MQLALCSSLILLHTAEVYLSPLAALSLLSSVMSRYDNKDTPESSTRLPPRQHARTGENTSFDTPELLTMGEDMSSEIPVLFRHVQFPSYLAWCHEHEPRV